MKYDNNSLILTRNVMNETDSVKIDMTFLTRLSNLITYVAKNYGAGDFLIDEEAWYIKSVAEKMLAYQKETMTPGEERQYFQNLEPKRKNEN